MRLIDADKAYKKLIDSIDWMKDQDYEAYSAIGDDIRIILDEQPTAFDMDKVIEQLEELKGKNCCDNILCALCKYNDECYLDSNAEQKLAIDSTIKIVKGGGIE